MKNALVDVMNNIIAGIGCRVHSWSANFCLGVAIHPSPPFRGFLRSPFSLLLADEVNGKAGNLNSALRIIFPAGSKPSHTDVVAVFDCDQVCDSKFFVRTLPLLDESPAIGLVR